MSEQPISNKWRLHNIATKLGGEIVAKYIHYNTDAYIISHPRSGRTWLRILIGKILCDKFGFSAEDMLDTYKLTSRAGILRTQLIHDHTSYTESFKYLRLSKDKRIYKNKRIILLIRNIKDIMVSYYFYVTRRDHDYNGNISDFIRSSKFGVKNIITFYNTWYESRKIPLDFMLLRYEDMIHNTGECLFNTMKFLGLDNIDENDVRKAIEFASFKNLKKLEREEYFSQSSMRPGNKSDNESYTIRKGEVKGYSSYLSESDIDYIDTLIQELGCPFE